MKSNIQPDPRSEVELKNAKMTSICYACSASTMVFLLLAKVVTTSGYSVSSTAIAVIALFSVWAQSFNTWKSLRALDSRPRRHNA